MGNSTPVPDADKGGVHSAQSFTQIVVDGDVILVVGPSRHKIEVSAHFLKRISPVFQVMLGAPMKEGNALATRCDNDAPVEIILPEDKEAPMEQVLSSLRRRPKLEEIFDARCQGDRNSRGEVRNGRPS
ncbi:uncharacterized protein LW93_13371 [Fusarium fujikuroi]|nr:uncharacterized protein LW93_13371 [Fusarium fujikuroi]